jgi:hypothetical protein
MNDKRVMNPNERKVIDNSVYIFIWWETTNDAFKMKLIKKANKKK